MEGRGKDNSGALPMLIPLYNPHNCLAFIVRVDLRLTFANILMRQMVGAHLTRGKGDLARTTHQLNDV